MRSDELPTIGLGSVIDYLAGHGEWVDGVVITGGEPTVWEDLGHLARSIKGLGLKVKLDTNGTRPRAIEALLEKGLIDYVAMDVKAPLDERYDIAAGVRVNLDDLRRSIDIVAGLLDSCEFRTTLVPGLVGEEEIVLIAKALSGVNKYVLQRFVPENSLDNSMRRVVPYDDGFVSRLVARAREYVGSCFYRGKLGVGLS